MPTDKAASTQKERYEPPKVLASYKKEELEAALKPHAQSGGGCGCSS